jgi:hypothetical protein
LNYAFVTAKEIKAAPAAEDKILTGQLLAGGHIELSTNTRFGRKLFRVGQKGNRRQA